MKPAPLTLGMAKGENLDPKDKDKNADSEESCENESDTATLIDMLTSMALKKQRREPRISSKAASAWAGN